ncbi:MAG: hypothetical protein Q9210_006144 [Variospora velana]
MGQRVAKVYARLVGLGSISLLDETQTFTLMFSLDLLASDSLQLSILLFVILPIWLALIALVSILWLGILRVQEGHGRVQPVLGDLRQQQLLDRLAPHDVAAIHQDRQIAFDDAIHFTHRVKARFVDRPDVFRRFVSVLEACKVRTIDTPDVVEWVHFLLAGHPDLIEDFHTFLPPDYLVARLQPRRRLRQRVRTTV